MKNVEFSAGLSAGKSNKFENLYFLLSREIVANGSRTGSRNGDTVEYLNFKTIVENPRARCVGGYGRDINVFFLLAEAMWIWTGRKDVEFLNIFNSNMAQFSDDGMTFHAPYGYRMRFQGEPSSSNAPYNQRFDQLHKALNLLSANPEDRRVVISIWNPELDLGTQSKDLPCNDMIMYKIRNGRLHQTIQNRSNDLHWGLPTNVFQFSFIGEVMSKILGVELGDQVHNSQSLHCYLSNPLTNAVSEAVVAGDSSLLYDDCSYSEMDFRFDNELVNARLEMVDSIFNRIIDRLLMYHRVHDTTTLQNIMQDEAMFVDSIAKQSEYFAFVYDLLHTYILYTKTGRTNDDRLSAIENLLTLRRTRHCFDYLTLGLNFFVRRLKERTLPEGLLSLNSKDLLGKL